MNTDALQNLADPAVLFFFLGLFVGFVRSNLEIPAPVAKFLSLYLLLSLGFKGGQAMREAGFTADGVKVLSAAIVLALTIPVLAFVVLRRRVSPYDAAAIAATYGSVSAVTFLAASQFVTDQGTPAGGYLTVALVLMESPAIVMAVVLATWVRTSDPATAASGGVPPSPRSVIGHALTDGANLLLIGSLVVGYISGADGGTAMNPFVDGIFKGLLAFFLLEMGLLVARQLREVRDIGPFLIVFALVTPLVDAALALGIGTALGLSVGDLTLLAVLGASGSYIVVPAVVRFAIPEARPSRYLTMALAVTFPFNIVVGIPLYHAAAERLVG